jgi:hypothetical protein
MQTRADYEVIAKLIVIAKEFHPDSTEGIEALTMMMVGAFGQENPRFRQDLFLKAAEHSSTKETLEDTWSKFQQEISK